MTDIDRMLRISREIQPNLWERTEHVAKIIDPSAFMDDWVITPPEREALMRAKLSCLQAAAMKKANEILTYLGVNTETDWYSILGRLAGEPAPTSAQEGEK